MRVLHTARNDTREPGYVADLDVLLPQCDVVSLHVPGGDATRHLIDARRLGADAAVRPCSSTPRAAPSSTKPRSRTRCTAAACSPPASTCTSANPKVDRRIAARAAHGVVAAHRLRVAGHPDAHGCACNICGRDGAGRGRAGQYRDRRTSFAAPRAESGAGVAKTWGRPISAAMSERVRGVVAKGVKEPVTVETIVVPDPGPGEAKVRVQACGVCHTDLHYREGGIGDEFPYLLGHEAAGIVEAVGPGVTSVAPGDFVVLNWRAVCGECRACRRGRPWYCFATHNATAEDDAHRRNARCRPRSASARSPRRRSLPRGRRRRSTRPQTRKRRACSAAA